MRQFDREEQEYICFVLKLADKANEIEKDYYCKCQHRNAIKFRNENVVLFRYDYLSSGSTKS